MRADANLITDEQRENLSFYFMTHKIEILILNANWNSGLVNAFSVRQCLNEISNMNFISLMRVISILIINKYNPIKNDQVTQNFVSK